MAMRLVLFGLIGLLLGTAFASGVQVGFNMLRYLVQPSWLPASAMAGVTAIAGIVAAAAFALPQGLVMRRAVGDTGLAILVLAMACGLLADPYFLAELGWREPARALVPMRALAALLAALALTGPVIESGARMLVWLPLAGAAIAAHAMLDRFAWVPVLGGDLDLAAMSPLHLLVFARAVVLLLAAGGLAVALRGRG